MVTVVVMSTLCGVLPLLSYTSANTATSSFCGNDRVAAGGAGSTPRVCSSGCAVGSCDAVIDVSATPLMLKGAFAKSGTSRSYCTDPTLPPFESCAATRS